MKRYIVIVLACLVTLLPDSLLKEMSESLIITIEAPSASHVWCEGAAVTEGLQFTTYWSSLGRRCDSFNGKPYNCVIPMPKASKLLFQCYIGERNDGYDRIRYTCNNPIQLKNNESFKVEQGDGNLIKMIPLVNGPIEGAYNCVI